MILTVTLNPCIDTTIYVRDHRLHRIHRSEQVTRVAGGKGVNAARIIQRLGEEAVALVVLAGHSGRLIADLLASDAIPHVAVWVEGESREVVTILETDTPDYQQTAYVEPGAAISPDARVRLFERFEQLLPMASLVLLTGPAPDPFSTDIYAGMIQRAREEGIPVFLDSRGGAFRDAVRAIPTLVKPNEAEAAEWRGVVTLSESEQMKVVDALRELGIPWVVLTLGEAGAIADCEGERYRLLPPRVTTVNPIASGDTMMGAMAYAWVRGESPETILRLGVAAGAANASVWKAAGCSREQVISLADKVQIHRL